MGSALEMSVEDGLRNRLKAYMEMKSDDLTLANPCLIRVKMSWNLPMGQKKITLAMLLPKTYLRSR